MLKVGSRVVVSKETGIPQLYGKFGKIMSCRYKDITKNKDVIWQVKLSKPLELNGVVLQEVWLPETHLVETVPVSETATTWDALL